MPYCAVLTMQPYQGASAPADASQASTVVEPPATTPSLEYVRDFILHFCEAFYTRWDSIGRGRSWNRLQGVLSVRPLGKWYRPYYKPKAAGQLHQICDVLDTARCKRKIAGRMHRVGDLSPLASHLTELSLDRRRRLALAPQLEKKA